jgi:hypothetical protein
MELINRIPLQAIAFRQFDKAGELDCVVAVRGTFQHVQDGTLALMAQQEEFQWTDAYDGDPHQGILLRQTDLTPEKPCTDITFLGNSHAPNGKAARSWTCAVRVGKTSKALRVHGERFWRPVFRDAWAGFSATQAKRALADWALSEAEPVLQVPISWANAYGGAVPGAKITEFGIPEDTDPANPLGCGIIDPGCTDDEARIRAPQITAPEDATPDWRKRHEPQGFGPISPWWRQRQRHAGTYDDAWLETRHPLLPHDFDPLFWQCAHPDLIASPWLNGDEDYELENLHPVHARARGRLPGVTLGVRCEREERDEWNILKLDGVQFDWRSDDRVLLTWRARFPLPDAGETRLTLNRVTLAAENEAQAQAAE